MTEINPPLKPDGQSAKWKFPSFGPRTASPPPSQATPLLPGFMPRLGAFLIDLIALYAVAYAANTALRPQLLAFGPASVFLALAVMLLYFTLLNGPLGKGSTLGKQMFHLRVVGLDAAPLSFGAALKRALLQTAPIWVVQSLQFVFRASRPDTSLALALQVLMDLGLGFFVANTMLVLLSPAKRSIHDLAAQSIVVRTGQPAELLSPAIAAIIEGTPRLSHFHRALIAAGLLLFVFTSAPQQIRRIRSGDWQQSTARIKQLENILGSDKIEIRRQQVRDVPLGGPKVEEEERRRLREGQKRLEGPRRLENVMILAAYGQIPETDKQTLASLDSRMPELREWVVDLASVGNARARKDAEQAKRMADYRQRLRDMQVHEALLEVQVVEVLDLVIEFPGQPVLSFRESFSKGQLETLGITPATQPAR